MDCENSNDENYSDEEKDEETTDNGGEGAGNLKKLLGTILKNQSIIMDNQKSIKVFLYYTMFFESYTLKITSIILFDSFCKTCNRHIYYLSI